MPHCHFSHSLQEDSNLEILLIHVSHLHFKKLHGYLNKIGLYKGQPHLLRLLWSQDGQTQKELAAAMSIQPSTLAKMVSRMEHSGYLFRRTDSKDMRVSRIYLTQAGRDLEMKVKEVYDKLYEDCFGNFTSKEKADLNRLFIRLRKNLLKSLND